MDEKNEKQPEPSTAVKVIMAGQKGLVLRDLNEMWRFATCVLRSGLAPKGLSSVESIVVALQYGAEVGLSPMASLQNICVINGRPRIWGDGLLAICMASGLFDQKAFKEWREEVNGVPTAYCQVRRLPDGELVTRTFSKEQARRAGLLDKDNWKMYEDRMLQMRARSLALHDVFADLLLGLRMVEDDDLLSEADVLPAQGADELARMLADQT